MSRLRRPLAATPAWVVVLSIVWAFPASTTPAIAQDDASGNRIAPATEAASRRVFLREIHRSLKAYDERLTGLAGRMPAEPRAAPNPGLGRTLFGRLLSTPMRREPNAAPNSGMVRSLEIAAKSAEAGSMNAKLTREIAEIAVREYREGNYVQDLLTVEGEIRLAQSDLNRSRDMVQVAQRDADRLWTQLQEEGRRLRCESFELKKIALVDYAGPRRVKELEAEVAKARVDERAKEAEWQLSLKQAERARKESLVPGPRPPMDHRHRASVLMTRAIAIEGRIQARLAEFARQPESGAMAQKEIRELTNELGAVIEEVEAEAAASDLDGVRRRIRGAGRRE